MAKQTQFEFLILKNYAKERHFVIKKQPGFSLLETLTGFLKRKT